MRCRGPLAMALGAALTLLPLRHVAAADRPQAQPIRDVTVEYQLVAIDDSGAASRARTIKVYWAGGGALMRIEMGDGFHADARRQWCRRRRRKQPLHDMPDGLQQPADDA